MPKHVRAFETIATTTHLVLPENTNTIGNLMGGQLLNWMDVTSAISAHRFCHRVVVTAAVNNVSFDRPIALGDIVTIEAKVSRAFSTSMEVYMEVFVEGQTNGVKHKCNSAMYTFVAVDQLGSPINVPELLPETDSEKKALRRGITPPSIAPYTGWKTEAERCNRVKSVVRRLGKNLGKCIYYALWCYAFNAKRPPIFAPISKF